jgi:diaminopimelate decarboxylase
MSYFTYQNNQLFAEQLSVKSLADNYGTPLYIYSRAALEAHFNSYAQAVEQGDLVCYAVKANSNIAVLNVLARLGAGFDIVSVGELERALLAGGKPEKIVFSGVAKTAAEMRRALEVGIHCFNVESAAELERLNTVALSMGKKAPISIRVNPDVDAKTHPYISTGLSENKFGIHISQVLEVYLHAKELQGLTIKGIDCHIGSQLTDTKPFLDALERVLAMVDTLQQHGINLQHIDLGGGLGVRYKDETPPNPTDYIQQLKAKLKGRSLSLIVEPGRSIAANAGILVSQVEYIKSNGDKHFAIVDAAMNDMIRPALYQAWMDIQKVTDDKQGVNATFDIVGPVCETSDFIGKDRALQLQQGDYIAQFSAGAYGFTMASNYNSRGRAAELMVDGEQCYIVRQRETVADLVRGESLLP